MDRRILQSFLYSPAWARQTEDSTKSKARYFIGENIALLFGMSRPWIKG